MGILKTLKKMFGSLSSDAGHMATTVADTAKKVTDEAIEKVGDKVENMTGAGGEMIDRVQDKVKDVAHTVIEKAADKLADVAEKLEDEEIITVEEEK